MNLQIINNCVGTDPGLPTAGTDPGRRYLQSHAERLAQYCKAFAVYL